MTAVLWIIGGFGFIALLLWLQVLGDRPRVVSFPLVAMDLGKNRRARSYGALFSSSATSEDESRYHFLYRREDGGVVHGERLSERVIVFEVSEAPRVEFEYRSDWCREVRLYVPVNSIATEFEANIRNLTG